MLRKVGLTAWAILLSTAIASAQTGTLRTANRTRILCEASSGYHYDKEGAPRTFFLPRQAIAALGKLGFSTDDTRGNFRYEAGIGTPPDLNVIADLILTALHDSYGARAGETLRFNAPFAPGATSKCVPVS